MKRKIIIILLITLVVNGCKIPQEDNPMTIHDDSSLQAIQKEIIANPNNYNAWTAICTWLTEQRKFSELSAFIRDYAPWPSTEKAFCNELQLYLGIYYAQTSLFLEDFHTAKQFLEKIDSSILPETPGKLLISYHNVSAILAMKMDMDYSKAIHHFNSALKYTDTTDARNWCALLSNIASAYYDREDTAGLSYAMQAYKYSFKYGEPVTAGYSAIVIAQLYILSEKIDKAIEYADKAEKIFHQTDNASLHIVRGDIASLQKKYETAIKHYETALENARHSDPICKIEVLFKYGELMLNTGNPKQAIAFLKKGLDLSYEADNIEYRQKILRGLSDCYDAMSDKDNALKYYKAYRHLSDSLSIIRKERDFHKQLMNYERMEHETTRHRNELAIQRNHRHIILVISILTIITVIALCLWRMYINKNRMYKQLMEQYDKYRQRTQKMIDTHTEHYESQKEKSFEKDKSLYSLIEKEVEKNKLWRNKDLTLEKLAEIVGSNRSYVSSAINNLSGMSFSNYIKMKRIVEATEFLSDTDNDLPLKVLADTLGFTSLSSFSKVFQSEIGVPPSKYREYYKK